MAEVAACNGEIRQLTMNVQDIISLYLPSEAERDGYPCLAHYARHVDAVTAVGTVGSRDRFCLVGLFGTYRALNHWGFDVDTRNVPTGLGEPHRSRLENFSGVTSHHIRSTAPYLEILGLKRFLLIVGPLGSPLLGRLFLRYVRATSSPWK